jgi:alcohol dehydrogenase class IV
MSFATKPRVVLRYGTPDDLLRRIALVVDAGLAHTGLVATLVVARLRSANGAIPVCGEVQAGLPEQIALGASEKLATAGVDSVLPIGGGCAMDVSRLVAYLLRSPGALATIHGADLLQRPRLLLVLTPTTAGTGPEVTPISTVTIPTVEKRGAPTWQPLPDVALPDSNTTRGVPSAVMAATGIDVTAAAIAPLAALHALAYPLGGCYHVPHGPLKGAEVEMQEHRRRRGAQCRARVLGRRRAEVPRGLPRRRRAVDGGRMRYAKAPADQQRRGADGSRCAPTVRGSFLAFS